MDSTRDEPVESGHDEATDGQKLEGVIQQVRGDVALGSVDDVRKMVQQRLEEAGLPASPNESTRSSAPSVTAPRAPDAVATAINGRPLPTRAAVRPARW